MNTQVQKISHLFGHQAAIYALAPFMNAQSFLSGGGDGYLVSWDWQNLPQGQLQMRVEGSIFCVDFAPELGWAVVGTMQGGIYWLDLRRKQVIRQQLAHKKGIFAVKFIQNRLFSCGADGCLTIWDLERQTQLETLHISPQPLRSFAFLEDKNQLFVGATGGDLYILDLTNFSLQNVVNQAHTNSIFSIFADKNRGRIWTGGRDAYLKGWQTDLAGENQGINCFSAQAAHLFCVNSVAINPIFALIATASRDKTIRIWNADDATLLKSINLDNNGGHLRSVNSLFWLDNQHLVSASDDKSLIVWQINRNSEL